MSTRQKIIISIGTMFIFYGIAFSCINSKNDNIAYCLGKNEGYAVVCKGCRHYSRRKSGKQLVLSVDGGASQYTEAFLYHEQYGPQLFCSDGVSEHKVAGRCHHLFTGQTTDDISYIIRHSLF